MVAFTSYLVELANFFFFYKIARLKYYIIRNICIIMMFTRFAKSYVDGRFCFPIRSRPVQSLPKRLLLRGFGLGKRQTPSRHTLHVHLSTVVSAVHQRRSRIHGIPHSRQVYQLNTTLQLTTVEQIIIIIFKISTNKLVKEKKGTKLIVQFCFSVCFQRSRNVLH